MTGTQDTIGPTIGAQRPRKRPLTCVSNAASVRRLVEDNLGLAYFLLRRFKTPAWVDVDDLESSALLGLFQAAETFDPSKGRFAGYAAWAIKHAILRSIKRQKRRRLILIGDTGDDKPTRIDLLEDRHDERERIMVNAERAADLAVKLLTPAEFLIVCGRRRGQPAGERRTTDAELARMLGCARQTICGIRRDALLRLRFEAIRRGIEAP